MINEITNVHITQAVEYVPVTRLRDLFGIGRSRGWMLLAEGKIQGRKFGRSTLVECSSVRRFLATLPSAR